ncbi:MAG TPA: hypothetical protein VGN08_05650 [Solirubrobacteraceae bacterium]
MLGVEAAGGVDRVVGVAAVGVEAVAGADGVVGVAVVVDVVAGGVAVVVRVAVGLFELEPQPARTAARISAGAAA